jgi:hypothetical protein
VPIGSEHPIALQTMTTTDTRDVKATVEQVRQYNKIINASACFGSEDGMQFEGTHSSHRVTMLCMAECQHFRRLL